MIANGISVSGDLFSDYNVKGNLLSRPALDALLKQATVDRTISHVFIPRRNRLARPENPLDGMQIEMSILAAGASVLMNGVIEPLSANTLRLICGVGSRCSISRPNSACWPDPGHWVRQVSPSPHNL